MNAIDDDGRASKDTLASIIDTYQLLADRYYTHATPTLFNAGTINHTLSSCYLLSIDDSLDSIYSRLTDISKISKFSGGVGVHMSQIRASGSVIASTIGRSEGLVPLMRVYNESTRYVSQGGGKRKGSTAVYIEPWHADIESTILSQKQQGAPERLCRDLFLALWVPDIFMVRLKQALKSKQTEFTKEYIKIYRPMPDINFIDYLLDLLDPIDPKAFEVPHSMLATFNVAVSEYDIEEYFSELGLVGEEDWSAPSIKYMLTVGAFKRCLIHAPNTMKYSKFYKYCDEAFCYYMKYRAQRTSQQRQDIEHMSNQLLLAKRVIEIQNALKTV